MGIGFDVTQPPNSHAHPTHNRMAEKLYNIKFIVANMTEIVVNDN